MSLEATYGVSSAENNGESNNSDDDYGYVEAVWNWYFVCDSFE